MQFDEFFCERCGIFCKKPSWWRSENKFCSIQCMSIIRGKNTSGSAHYNWKGGDNRTGSHTICKRIKKEIGKCQKCDSKENLQIHHKIKVSERPDLASDPKNIEIICVQCHAKKHPEFEGMLLKIKKRYATNCVECGKEYLVKKYKLKTTKCCSTTCNVKRSKGIYMAKKEEFKDKKASMEMKKKHMSSKKKDGKMMKKKEKKGDCAY